MVSYSNWRNTNQGYEKWASQAPRLTRTRQNHRTNPRTFADRPSLHECDMAQILLVAKNRDYRFAVEPDEPVLFAGIRCGVDLPYACATGTCGTCRAKLVHGHASSAWSDAPGLPQPPALGDVLLCQCLPTTDLVVELDSNVPAFDLDSYAAPQHYRAQLASVRMLAPGVAAFTCDLDRSMKFDAGQFVLIATAGVQGYRAYSMTRIASSCSRLELLIKQKPDGAFSKWLFTQAKMGAPLKIFGPLGRATFNANCTKNLLIIAGGSGIAGMMAILGHALEGEHFSRFRGSVFFGVRTWVDAFMLDELAALTQGAAGRLAVTIALSDGDVPQSARDSFPTLHFATGLVHDVARAQMVGQYENTRAYVAGPPQAVNAALRYLIRDARLPAAEIHYDKFS